MGMILKETLLETENERSSDKYRIRYVILTKVKAETVVWGCSTEKLFIEAFENLGEDICDTNIFSKITGQDPQLY